MQTKINSNIGGPDEWARLSRPSSSRCDAPAVSRFKVRPVKQPSAKEYTIEPVFDDIERVIRKLKKVPQWLAVSFEVDASEEPR